MLDFLGAMVHWFFFGISFGWWQWRNRANDRAVIFVRQGPFTEHVLATRADITKDGEVFQYQKGKHAVIVKPTDLKIYWERERLLSVVDGEVIATSFDKPEPEVKTERVAIVRIPIVNVTLSHEVEVKPDPEAVIPKPAEPEPMSGSGRQQDETLISNVIDGHLATELAESPTMPGKGGWGFKELRWILLIVVALIIAFVVYKFVLHGHLPMIHTTAGNSTAPEPTPEPSATPHLIGYVIQIRNMLGV